jgi:U3 small nucleolar RNA-associated protein 18
LGRSKTGIVNVYDSNRAFASSDDATLRERKPLKALGNLTTAADTLAFNSDSQLLALASSDKRDALKMVHLPSLTVFSNWPTAGTPLGKVTSVAFSRGSEFVAMGSAQGKVALYLLEHYRST